ncbi:helix-turn-helix transcriptional regulator [Streptomyces sp. NPDC047085]|uniref:helix-turn-helix domain-containing protein n=1 Tax=Streptomyces sp. NPDC047085 TaxID=3155140 RepID=UPI0033DAE503
MTVDQVRQGNSTTSVLGRRLGAELLKLRIEAGFTQPQAAKALSASTAKVAKMEGGWVPVRDPDIRALCELYGVHDPGTIGSLLELAKVDRERRKAKGWWQEYSFPGVMQEYIALEHAATTIRAWQPAFIPGLLQTPEYAGRLRDNPAAQMTKGPEPDEEFVAARLARRRRLIEEPALSLRAVIYEAAFHNFPGGAPTARAQIDELMSLADLPSVSIRIYPFSAGTHAALNGSFNIISFASPGAMDVVYVEGPLAERWVEGGDGAAAYDELFEKIAELALDEQESVSFLHDLRKEL